LGCLTLLPCIGLWLFSTISSPDEGSFLQSVPQLLPILAHCGTLVVVYTATMLGVSALCRRPMFAGLIWFAAFEGLPTLAGAISASLGSPAAVAFAPNTALQLVAGQLYDVDGLRQQFAGNP